MSLPVLEFLTASVQEIKFRALEDLRLPSYKGSTFRGAFGHAFRTVACVLKRNTCDSCLLRNRCAYSVCFETPVPETAPMLQKYPYAPHPFILEPPLDGKREYASGTEFSIRLILVGKSQEFLAYFLYAFEEMGKNGLGSQRGKVELVEVNTPGEEKSHIIYDPVSRQLCGAPFVITESIIAHKQERLLSKSLRLVFESPTRIKTQGKLTATPDFATLAPALLRRLNLLHCFFCEGDFAADVRPLLDSARSVNTLNSNLRWVDWTRYSTRQETKMQLGGFVGTLVISPPPPEILTYIIWGELLHLGKGGSFGLGKYRVETC